MVDSTSSFRLSFGFKVLVVSVSAWVALPFEVSFLLAPSPSNVSFRGSTPIALAISNACRSFAFLRPPAHAGLTLPISRLSQPSYGCYIVCARSGLWVCSAPQAPVGFLSFRVLHAVEPAAISGGLCFFAVAVPIWFSFRV